MLGAFTDKLKAFWPEATATFAGAALGLAFLTPPTEQQQATASAPAQPTFRIAAAAATRPTTVPAAAALSPAPAASAPQILASSASGVTAQATPFTDMLRQYVRTLPPSANDEDAAIAADEAQRQAASNKKQAKLQETMASLTVTFTPIQAFTAMMAVMSDKNNFYFCDTYNTTVFAHTASGSCSGVQDDLNSKIREDFAKDILAATPDIIGRSHSYLVTATRENDKRSPAAGTAELKLLCIPENRNINCRMTSQQLNM